MDKEALLTGRDETACAILTYACHTNQTKTRVLFLILYNILIRYLESMLKITIREFTARDTYIPLITFFKNTKIEINYL